MTDIYSSIFNNGAPHRIFSAVKTVDELQASIGKQSDGIHVFCTEMPTSESVRSAVYFQRDNGKNIATVMVGTPGNSDVNDVILLQGNIHDVANMLKGDVAAMMHMQYKVSDSNNNSVAELMDIVEGDMARVQRQSILSYMEEVNPSLKAADEMEMG